MTTDFLQSEPEEEVISSKGMARRLNDLPPYPLHCIPYNALNELAEVFDSPSVDGQRTLEGLAEAIYTLSDYTIKVDHNKVSILRSRCASGESPTVKFIQDLAKYKDANLRILQMAICSLETRADDILVKYLGEITRRYKREEKPGLVLTPDNWSQNDCNCYECSDNGAFSLPVTDRTFQNARHPRHNCGIKDCAHNGPKQYNHKRKQSNSVNRNQMPSHHNNFRSGRSFSNNSNFSEIQNDEVKTPVMEYEMNTFSMNLFGNGTEFMPPADFDPIPPSDYEGEDEEFEESVVLSERRIHSENIQRQKTNVPARRVQSMPVGSDQLNTDPARRHSHPVFNKKSPPKKDCESDGDIPNIPDACTCYRSPVIHIGPKTVFVSLADDSKHHIKEVLTMCTKLQEAGFEVKCDMMESLFTEQNINVNEWLDQCFTRAVFVIFCISPKYFKYIGVDNSTEAHASDNKFHTRYIFDRARSEFIQNNSMNKRFLPVLFRNSGAKLGHIPEFLRSTIRYVFPETFGHLTAFLQKQ
ncbi:uncharacterized protein LOC133175745 isoform X1 [Saccostrea echinata]|uniref:uncharacterized protein LOC133175745 isoform X1 n=2 Tax=Saccostrea echinata TaxID=191078 RepID=UPI002A820C99|nr:uncharacterized protein LOC133175745 isoform X1 [Saccostrea echinata]